MPTTVDLALCGGGLQNALIVAALRQEENGAAAEGPAWGRVAMVERGAVGGNHTWCFFGGDLSPAMQRRVAPFVTRSWAGYEVRFPGYRRQLSTPYFMISSTRLRRAVRELLAARGSGVLWENAAVERLGAATLYLRDGRRVRAGLVIDARGGHAAGAACGYQKFYGQEVTLREPHGLTRPIVMDATVAQHDGFRFMYVLPLGARRALLEDTTFSDGPELDEEQRARGIGAWLKGHGWRVARVDRTERGVLPMPLRPPPLAPDEAEAGVLRGGYGGGWFHPGTGYSLPLAAEFAELVAATPAPALPAAAGAARRRLQRRQRFCCLLNRLLFQGYPDAARRAVFARFYRLPASTIHRFYRMRLHWYDQVRILGGRPPRGLSLSAWRSRNRRLLPPAAARAAAGPAAEGPPGPATGAPPTAARYQPPTAAASAPNTPAAPAADPASDMAARSGG